MTAQHFGLFVHIDGAAPRPATDDEIIAIARTALDAKIKRQGNIASPADAKAFVSLRLGNLPHEIFAAVFVDAQHRVIEFRELFRGTLTQASVYPREVVKEALKLTPFHGHFRIERESPKCPKPNHRTHPGFASKWSNWSEAAANPASCPKNLAVTPPAS